MIAVEIENRSGARFDEDEAAELCRTALAAEGMTEGDLGLTLVSPDEMRTLKREHLGLDETTDVLSFPIDGREELPAGIPRQLGDVVLCPQAVGDAWRWPLVHGLLHLLGYDHGAAMEQREKALVPLPAMPTGSWPAITRRRDPLSPLPRQPALAADESGPRLGARDPEARQHHRKGHRP